MQKKRNWIDTMKAIETLTEIGIRTIESQTDIQWLAAAVVELEVVYDQIMVSTCAFNLNI